MRYEEIRYDSPDYYAACTLRHEVLRLPIGMRLRPKDVAGEDRQLHFIARDERGGANEVVATVSFKPLGPAHIKLRQMAVAPQMHGNGVGRQLVKFAEAQIREKGFQTVETNARHYAQGFYEKLGYIPASDLFEEVGLHTLKMLKTL